MVAESWKRTTIGEQAELLTGYPFRSIEYTGDIDDIPLVRGDNVVQGMFRWDDVKRWSREKVNGISEFFLKEGDVVLAMDRPWIEAGLKYACVSIYDIPSLLVQRVARLRAKPSLDQRFLKYVIATPEFTNYILGVQTGTAVPHISSNQIRQYEFALPPLPTQRAIAGVLGALDDKIELNRRMNRTLEELARAVFREWFVEGEEVGVWETGRLGDFVENFDSQRVPLSSRERLKRKGEYPYYGATSVMDYVDDYLFDGSFVLIAEDGSVIDKENHPVLQYVWGKFWVNNHAHILKGAKGICNEHLYLFLKEVNILPYITGAVQPKLNQANMNQIPFVIPPLELCNEFREFVSPLFARIRTNEEESRTLAALRDALLPRLMRGEVRVSEL